MNDNKENQQKVIIGVVKESIQSNEFVKKMEKIMSVNCTEIIVVKNGSNHELTTLFDKISIGEKSADQVIVNNLAEFGFGLIKFWEHIGPILAQGVEVISIEEDLVIVNDCEFAKATEILFDMHKRVLSESSKQGQLRAEERGFKPGRPNLSEELVRDIRNLRNQNKYSLREIAELCNVSVGTVFKYTKD